MDRVQPSSHQRAAEESGAFKRGVSKQGMIKSEHKKRRHLSSLQWMVHLGAWVPLAVLLHDFLTDNLTVNPIQAAEQRTGDIAIILLALSLACTPLNLLLRQPQLIRIRRPLGLYAYMYAAIHFMIFIGPDYGLDLRLILQAITEKPYILVGFLAFLVLSTLAITSFRSWQFRLGKNWKRLHRLVYAINLLVVLHFGWSVKGDFFRLRGDIMRPLIAGVIIIILLLFRLPAIRRSIAHGQRRTAPDPAPSSEKALPPGEKTAR